MRREENASGGAESSWTRSGEAPAQQAALEPFRQADPFPIQKDGRYSVFFEEFLFGEDNGYICCLELDLRASATPPVAVPVLERDYDLSYPFVFEHRGDMFMIPESSANHTVEVYCARRFPDDWELCEVPFEDIDAVDPTLVEIDGTWWLFACVASGGSHNVDELHLFYADNPMGPFRPHRRNPVKTDARSTRPAGRIVEYEGAYFRPTQDCTQGYGYATLINRITTLSRDHYAEKPAYSCMPWNKTVVATHTLNFCEGLAMVDARVVRPRWRL